MPPPHELRRNKAPPPTVTFRLNDEDHAELLLLAERGGMGHTTLVRRIVEHYIQEHAPRRGARRSKS
jgi:predicted DNA-binding protein